MIPYWVVLFEVKFPDVAPVVSADVVLCHSHEDAVHLVKLSAAKLKREGITGNHTISGPFYRNGLQ